MPHARMKVGVAAASVSLALTKLAFAGVAPTPGPVADSQIGLIGMLLTVATVLVVRRMRRTP